MSSDELRALLSRIHKIDHRRWDDLTVKAWMPLMAKIPYDDAVEAVNMHFRDSTAYLLPSHIVGNARRIAATRRAVETANDWQVDESGKVPMPPHFHQAVSAARAATNAAIAAGHARGSQVVKDAAWAAAAKVLDGDW